MDQLNRFIIPFVIVFTYVCFFIASSVGPGELNAQNVKLALDIYPYDRLLFYPKICGTCKIQKPARSKHCSVCKMCVARSDHHCGWINQCVGHKNHRYFILFLYSAVQICWYGTYLINQIFASRMYDTPMYKFLVATKRWDQLGPLKNYHIFLYQLQTDRSLGALGVFAGLAGLVIFIFFLYNLYLIATGVTTNETFKWEDIGEMIHRREIVEVTEVDSNKVPIGPKSFEQRDRSHPRHPRYVEPPQPSPPQQQQQQQEQQQQPEGDQQQKKQGQPKTPSKEPKKVLVREVVIEKMKDINNIYDEGVIKNIKSVFWPPTLETKEAKTAKKTMYERVQKSRKGA
ncbi:hypothetical protein BGZ76_004481 [Entomortierella beljakovae]|nr:hypothetical protein BGZ76_004481 [Entomortierella beljakovae]